MTVSTFTSIPPAESHGILARHNPRRMSLEIVRKSLKEL